ncbi:MAG: LuxR C-terminal-related transcriptional regulator [Pseudonocardiaceae bacterium]
MLTVFDDDSVFAAMRAGALGYVLKGAAQEEIVRAIHAVAARLGLAPKTVTNHASAVFTKLQVVGRAEVVQRSVTERARAAPRHSTRS